MNTWKMTLSTLVVAIAAAFSAPSEAATALRINANHGAVGCHAVGATTLKYNSKGVTNMSASAGTVFCGGVATPTANGGDVVVYEASFTNLNTTAVTVNCTLVDGIQNFTGAAATLYPKTITIAAGEMGYVNWDGLDTGGSTWNSGTRFYLPALSCVLPPQTTIAYTAAIYWAEVGQ